MGPKVKTAPVCSESSESESSESSESLFLLGLSPFKNQITKHYINNITKFSFQYVISQKPPSRTSVWYENMCLN